MTESSPRNLDALTSLRFFAAAMIVLQHSLAIFKLDAPLLHHAVLDQGVSFFFVLSGFILAYVYSCLDSGAAIRRFLRARIARIWPAHVTTFLITILLFDLPLSWIAMANLAMVHAWIPFVEYFFSYNSPSWSISTEFFFYLAFPILILNWSQTWRLKLLASALVLLGLILASNVLALPHLIDEEIYDYCVESHRVLASGGTAIFSFFDFFNAEHQDTFFKHASQHRQGHGDLLKFTTQETLTVFARRSGFSSVEFVDGQHEIPISGRPSSHVDVSKAARTFQMGQSLCVMRA